MKTIPVRYLQKKVRECVDASQRDWVVVTRHGRPAAVLIGVEGQDWEELVFQMNPEFWRTIEGRRKPKTIPMAEVQRRLATRRRSHRR